MSINSKYYRLLILCLTITTSCKNIISDTRTEILTNNNLKYWDLSTKGMKHVGTYRFDIDRSCFYLHYDYSEKRDYGYERTVWWSYKWAFINKDTLNISPLSYYHKIEKFNADTIILWPLIKDFKTKSDSSIYMILTPSKDQIDRADFNKIKQNPPRNINI